jgi:hypothetical protein
MAKTRHKNTGTLSDAGKKVFLKVSAETKDVCHCIMCRGCMKNAYLARQTISLRKYFNLKILGNNTNQWNCMYKDVNKV